MSRVSTFLRLAAVAALAGVLASPAVAEEAGEHNPLMPVITQGKGDKCVEPDEVMRKNHMKFLLHHRDLTVHEGIRTKKFDLRECIECHVQKDEAGQYIPINAPGQFCQSCHSYAAVHIDCFQCHATVPEKRVGHAKPGERHD